MKIGIIARGELGRGLGVQSFEAARHLDPAKVLVVDVGEHEHFPISPDQFPHATVVQMSPAGLLPEQPCRTWLAGLDVVLSFETFYDWRFCDWARDAGARTVVQANPEFYRHGLHRLPHPDGWWNPTTWRMEHLPPGARHVPVPVALDRFPLPRNWDAARHGARPRFLHPVGKWAMYDRNGTETFVRACYLAPKLDTTIGTQELLPPEVAPGGDWVTVEQVDRVNYWDAYDRHDVLVLPRRYGGLCLPAQEAMAAGMAVVMPDVSPNVDCWPVVPVPAKNGGRVPLPAGWVELAGVDPRDLANVLGRLDGDPDYLTAARHGARAWAEQHAWPRMVDRYLAELDHVLAHPQPAPALTKRSHDPFAPST